MRYFDTHAHLTDESFDADRAALIGRLPSCGAALIMDVACASADFEKTLALCKKHSFIYGAYGIHPHYASAPGESWEQALINALNDDKAVCLGEIGLDYHWDTTWKKEQEEALRVLLDLAYSKDLPVNIHCRDATEDFIRIIKDYAHLHLRGNLHAYSGSLETFRQISRYGDWSVGIGGVVTFRNSAIGKAIRDIPLERIVLETDAPYLSPVPHRGERNESSHLTLIAGFIASAKGISIEEVAAKTSENAKRLFGI